MTILENTKVPIADLLKNAFKQSYAKTIETAEGFGDDINMSGILTHLIQQTGRFTEYYASDLFISWNSVLRTLDECVKKRPRTADETNETNTDDIQEINYIIFGIRKCGVDGNTFTFHRLMETGNNPIYDYVYPEHVYRKIFGLKLTVTWELAKPMVTAELKDLTNCSFRPTDKDKESMRE